MSYSENAAPHPPAHKSEVSPFAAYAQAAHLHFSKTQIRIPKSGFDPGLTLKAAAMLRAAGSPRLAARVSVRWNSRMQTTAGSALYSKALVSLNPLIVQFGDAEVDLTFRHELAHLLAMERASELALRTGRRRRIAPHGPEWRQACADLGIPGEARCHALPLPRRSQTRKHVYQCPNCKVEVRRVRPFQRPTACLRCCRAHNGGRYHAAFRFGMMATE